jgi:hypothetical protein
MRTLRSLILLVPLLGAGCRSRVIQVTLINTSAQPLATIVVDYPGATFGVNQLAPGKTFRYKIKPQDAGPLKIQFTDASGHDHTYAGPSLHKNDEGAITIRLTQETATAEPRLGSR